MDRTLGFDPFFTALITIPTLILICFFNMYLLARYKKSCVTVSIHAISVFLICALFFYLMAEAVFLHPLATRYYHLSRFSFFLSGSSLIIGFAVALLRGRKYHYQNLSQNIKNTLSSIEDIVFMIDGDGSVAYINHPHQYHARFGDAVNMEQLRYLIQSKYAADLDSGKPPDSFEGPAEYELTFHQRVHGRLRISPIVIGGKPLSYTAVLEDISAVKQTEHTLREQNEFLIRANEELSQYVKVAGVLDAERERLHILEHVQETLIQDIEKALHTILQIKQHCFEDESYRPAMNRLAAQLRQVYSDVRCAVNQIVGKER